MHTRPFTTLLGIFAAATLLGGCATTQIPSQTILSSSDAFTTARKLILRAHRDPRLEGVRRSLQQVGGQVELRFTRSHDQGQDQVMINFLEEDGGSTLVRMNSLHLNTFGKPTVCPEASSLETTLVALLTATDPDLERQMGTMLVSSK